MGGDLPADVPRQTVYLVAQLALEPVLRASMILEVVEPEQESPRTRRQTRKDIVKVRVAGHESRQTVVCEARECPRSGHDRRMGS